MVIDLGVFLFVHPRAFLRAVDPTRGRMTGLITDVGGTGGSVILRILSSDWLRSSVMGEKGVKLASAGAGEVRLLFFETGIDCRARLLSKEEEIEDADRSMLARRDFVLLRLGENDCCIARGYGDGRFKDDLRDRTRRGRRSDGSAI